MKTHLIIVCFALLSCNARVQSQTFDPATTVIATKSGSVYTLAITQAVLLASIQGANSNISSIDSISYSITTSGVPSLLIYCKDASGNTILIGAELSSSGSNNFRVASTTGHSCAGAPCSSCSFLKNASHQIVGCDCGEAGLKPPPRCNHTITTSSRTLFTVVP